MFENKSIQNVGEFFISMEQRPSQAVYFYRFSSYSIKIEEFLKRYFEAARVAGVIIEGKIPNPDEKQLSYYEEIMGLSFSMNKGFVTASLRKWLPRMNGYQNENVADAIMDTLQAMQAEGKNENMLRNAYIKFMCWLYYKFERIVNQLGNSQVPKIMYEGTPGNYELKLLTILSRSGCDIILIEKEGDVAYLKQDPYSKYSMEYKEAGTGRFPEGFSIKSMIKDIQDKQKMQRVCGSSVEVLNCTNAWMSGNIFEDILRPASSRGQDEKLFYNSLVRIRGVEDKVTYLNELYQFYLQLKNTKRNVVIVENEILRPSVNEIGEIRRKSYTTVEQLISDITINISFTPNNELQMLMKKAFVELILEESKLEGMNINKLTNKAVYLLCWLKRYQKDLFGAWKKWDMGCFIYLGGCKSDNESLLMKYFSKLPVDILLLVPNRNESCCFEDPMLFEKVYTDSLTVNAFPMENGNLHVGTAAYHAERELDEIMYQDAGIYRNHQHEKAMALSLQTMYEEIAILWNQELKYRPNFTVTEGMVNMPVIFAKVSGVKDGNISAYWSMINDLITNNTILCKGEPLSDVTKPNQAAAHATLFYKNGRLQKVTIKQHPSYQYGFLREETQNHILDKLALLIEQKTIKGIGENGMEYKVISTILNLRMDILRAIQQFDFTKVNPKLIYINTSEKTISLEDSIICAFLNLVGFDVVFFVPNGYQTIENHYNTKIMEEHQVGEFLYDLRTPDFNTFASNIRRSWRDKIFKRGI